MTNKKGFTLIELLIVIGIMAILAVAVVLVLNPAELFAQARDSQRMEDLATVRDAIVYVQSTVIPAPTLGTTANTTGTTLTCSTAPLNIYAGVCVTDATREVDGNGWVAFNFSAATPVPLGTLPMDPRNGANYFYTYKGTASGLFKLGCVLESTKYSGNMTADGGSATGMYEIGTVMTAI